MKIKSLATEIKQHLNKNLEGIVSDVIIFGSQVWGTAGNDSDYDVLIVLKEKYNKKLQRKISDLCYELDLKYDVFLDTQIISEDELSTGIKGQHPVFRTAMRKGVHA